MKFRLTNKPDKTLKPRQVLYGRGYITKYAKKMLVDGAKYYNRIELGVSGRGIGR